MDNIAKYLISKNLLLIPISVLLIGLLPLNTGYYTLVRCVVFVFGIAAFLSLDKKLEKEKWIFLLSTIIYNPIFSIYFGTRLIWYPINILVLFFFWKLRKETQE